jgi:hypothetical protein
MATVDPLENALRELDDLNAGYIQWAEIIDAALKSAVKAIIPGRQQKHNVGPSVEIARKAFIRTLRRKAKA